MVDVDNKPTMKSLLLVAHGSRVASSNDEIKALSDKLSNQLSGTSFDYVTCAFLELATPGIPEGIDLCAQAGATEILVLPYFLSAGRHINEDVPGEVEKCRHKYPNVKIHICDYIGRTDGMVSLLEQLAIKGSAE